MILLHETDGGNRMAMNTGVKRIAGTKFILIREIRAGLWHELHHILTQLLVAEILQRVPVVYWGKGSLYAPSDGSNAFEQFFLPVSGFNVQDLPGGYFTYDPGHWDKAAAAPLSPLITLYPLSRLSPTEAMLMPAEDDSPAEAAVTITPVCGTGGNSKRQRHPLAECNVDVIVCDTYIDIENVVPYIPEDHPLCGLKRRDLFACLIRKYIRLKDEVRDFIDDFYNEHMRGAAFLAAHIRSSDKIFEVQHLHELNGRYAAEIDKILDANPGMRLFLMTDCVEILEEYRQKYGEILVHTECRRTCRDGMGVHFQEYPDNRLKGLEIIRDSWLAARCDYFIGNGYSNVSSGISELKDWEDGRIRLLY